MNRSQAAVGSGSRKCVYEERNRSSGRQQPLTQYHIRSNSTQAKQSEVRPSHKSAGQPRTYVSQGRPLLFNDAIEVSTSSRARDHRTAYCSTPPTVDRSRQPLARKHESVGLGWATGPCLLASRRAARWGSLGSLRMTSQALSKIRLSSVGLF